MNDPPEKRKRPGTKSQAASTPPSDNTDSSNNRREFDYDERVVHQVDSSIWRAIFRGESRLAVACDVCGRWLTDQLKARIVTLDEWIGLGQ